MDPPLEGWQAPVDPSMVDKVQWALWASMGPMGFNGPYGLQGALRRVAGFNKDQQASMSLVGFSKPSGIQALNPHDVCTLNLGLPPSSQITIVDSLVKEHWSLVLIMVPLNS